MVLACDLGSIIQKNMCETLVLKTTMWEGKCCVEFSSVQGHRLSWKDWWRFVQLVPRFIGVAAGVCTQWRWVVLGKACKSGLSVPSRMSLPYSTLYNKLFFYHLKLECLQFLCVYLASKSHLTHLPINLQWLLITLGKKIYTSKHDM